MENEIALLEEEWNEKLIEDFKWNLKVLNETLSDTRKRHLEHIRSTEILSDIEELITTGEDYNLIQSAALSKSGRPLRTEINNIIDKTEKLLSKLNSLKIELGKSSSLDS